MDDAFYERTGRPGQRRPERAGLRRADAGAGVRDVWGRDAWGRSGSDVAASAVAGFDGASFDAAGTQRARLTGLITDERVPAAGAVAGVADGGVASGGVASGGFGIDGRGRFRVGLERFEGLRGGRPGGDAAGGGGATRRRENGQANTGGERVRQNETLGTVVEEDTAGAWPGRIRLAGGMRNGALLAGDDMEPAAAGGLWARDRSVAVDPELGPAWIREAGVAAMQRTTALKEPATLRATGAARSTGGGYQGLATDTLEQSRERVASRWFGLRGAFEGGQEPNEEKANEWERETRAPVLAVYSMCGGVGKTSLVAGVGRALSGLGERVLLADTVCPGMLAYYFGAREAQSAEVRTFTPPGGSGDAAIQLLSYDGCRRRRDKGSDCGLAEELARNGGGKQRVLVDLNAGSGELLRELGGGDLTVLIPLLADMNSVRILQALQSSLEGMMDGAGRAIEPYFVLNQFDASLPLQLDVREVLRRHLGERLLPFSIRRSPAVGEGLAEGMTVMDYAPDCGVVEEYGRLATWVRSLSAPLTASVRERRWSER